MVLGMLHFYQALQRVVMGVALVCTVTLSYKTNPSSPSSYIPSFFSSLLLCSQPCHTKS